MTSYDRGAWGSVTERERKQPSKAARRRVKEAFDGDKLIEICAAQDFSAYADRFDIPVYSRGTRIEDTFYYYRNNGSNILAVGHLDSVQSNNACTVVETGAGLLACSGVLDDRLGVYVILDMLPKLGITCDYLLTTDEECANSTGRQFETDKQYNWMIEFDRGGTDVVLYQYESPSIVSLVEDSGARVGVGSYSDIADLEQLGCVGFNWGVGYQDYHSSRGHAWLEDTFRMVARFEKFHTAYAETRLAHEYADTKPWDFDEGADWVEADCGHYVDLSNDKDYVEWAGSFVLCVKCGEAK